MLSSQQLKAIYSNEQILLILISRLYFGTANKETISRFLTEEKLNWLLVHKIAKVHSIRAFLYSVIASFDLEVPQDFKEALKKRYNATKLKNLSQIKATEKIFSTLRERQIGLIPYKGAFFAAQYYNDWASRESQDIDFLVAKEDVEAIEDYFVAQGFIAKTTVLRPYLKYYISYFKDLVYHHPEANSSIEIHWRLMEQFSGDYPGHNFFSKGLINYKTGNFSIEKLAPSYDFLAVASNHFVKDMSMKFKYLIDMASLISKEKESLDQDLLFSCAKKYAFEKRLKTGLELVNQILGVEFLEDRQIALSNQQLQTPLALQIHLNRLYINEKDFIKSSLQLQDGKLQQARFLLKCVQYAFLPTYADINTLNLPARLLPLLMVLRPFRLMYQAIKPKSR